jgi:formiminotetrahydrofolate cyclodeaminase
MLFFRIYLIKFKIFMPITDQSIDVFLNELASQEATPGGGSVAAMMGAQSAALTSMVCRLTINKVNYENVKTEMEVLLTQSEQLREKLTAMIQADVEVFNRTMVCYRLPKTTDDEKVTRSVKIQQTLKEATIIPLDCVKACVEAIELSRIAADKGSLAVVSDAGVAVMAAYAGLKSAALNVYINTGSIKDKAFTNSIRAELASLLNGVEVQIAEIYQQVKLKL